MRYEQYAIKEVVSRDNIEAIRTAFILDRENRTATTEERLNGIQEVSGSIPLISTITESVKKTSLLWKWGFRFMLRLPKCPVQC